jgi:hypothetical protein
MNDLPPAYPLQWPAQRPRRSPDQRKFGHFKADTGREQWRSFQALTIAQARQRLQVELDRIGAKYAVISSDLELRLDGLPRSDRKEPADPAIAVYFLLAGKPHCLPCDTYHRCADNIAAIAAHIAATRAIERHGVASVAEMFAGFLALPSPDMERPWRDVLELRAAINITKATVKAHYTRLARVRHPDAGGSAAMMAELNVARDQAFAELQ